LQRSDADRQPGGRRVFGTGDGVHVAQRRAELGAAEFVAERVRQRRSEPVG
jgi:hypothetical protein